MSILRHAENVITKRAWKHVKSGNWTQAGAMPSPRGHWRKAKCHTQAMSLSQPAGPAGWEVTFQVSMCRGQGPVSHGEDTHTTVLSCLPHKDMVRWKDFRCLSKFWACLVMSPRVPMNGHGCRELCASEQPSCKTVAPSDHLAASGNQQGPVQRPRHDAEWRTLDHGQHWGLGWTEGPRLR